MAKTVLVRPVNVGIIREALLLAATAAVNEVADHAHQRALKDVPIRKVFRYGRAPRTGLRQQGRQETRTLSVQEAQSEAGIRRRLGLPSAFSETDSGRRGRGRQPAVQTALFPGNYRTRDRANDSRSLSRRVTAQIGSRQFLVDIDRSLLVRSSTGKMVPVARPIPNLERESDLSARGKYELKKRRAISKGKGEDEDTLGGALRRTVQDGLTPAAPARTHIKATISAGDEKVTYAKYVEFGTRHARAQPFLRPALAQAREELYEVVLRHLKSLGRA